MTTTKRVLTVLLFLSFSIPAIASGTPDTTSEDIQAFEEMFGKGPQQEDLLHADRLMLTATGSKKPVRLAPSVASVITSEDIEKIGATTLGDVLETIPGIHIGPSNKNQMSPIFSIRGIHSSLAPHVLFMINGIPITDVYTGSRVHGFRMPVVMISRIEVVRGPVSAVFGADSFAGTINIITKDGQEIAGTQVGGQYGSFDTSGFWLQHGEKYRGWDVAIGLEWINTKGDDDRIIDSDLQTSLDAGMDTNASLAPGPLNTEYEICNGNFSISKNDWTFKMWSWLRDDKGMADGVTQTLAPDNQITSRIFSGDLTYHNDTFLQDTAIDTRLHYRYQKTETYFHLLPQGAVVPIGADGNIDFVNPAGVTAFPDGVIGNPADQDDYYGFEQTFYYEGIKHNKFRLAMGYTYIDVTTSESKNFGPGVLDGSQAISDGTLTNVTGTEFIFMGDKTRHLTFISLQDEFAFARGWELTAGIRYDHYSDFGDTVNPRLALVWEARYDLTTKLMYGSAFRPPSFAELYAKNNPSNLGNEALDPEATDTYELTINYQPTNRLHTILSLFYYEIEGLIELVQDQGQTTLTAQNIRDQKGYGGELEFHWEPIDSLEIKGNVAYQRAKDRATKALIADAPNLQFYLESNLQFLPHWYANCQYFWIGKRHRANGDTREEIDDYDLVNFNIKRKNLFKNWELTTGVKNLFNEDIREPSQAVIPNDYPMEGRSIWAEVRCHF